MNGFGPGLPGGGDNRGDVEITLIRRRGSKTISFVRLPHMQRLRINCRENRNGRNSHIAAGTNDADSDFASVGNQDFTKHEFRCFVVGT